MAKCKRCLKDGLEWYKLHGKWVLWDGEAVQAHNELCEKISTPLSSSPGSYICKHNMLKERCPHGCL